MTSWQHVFFSSQNDVTYTQQIKSGVCRQHYSMNNHLIYQFIYEGINSGSSLDEHHDTARLLQLLHHLLQRVSSDDLCAFCFICKEMVDLFYRSVECTDLKLKMQILFCITNIFIIELDYRKLSWVQNSNFTVLSPSIK